MTGYRVRVKKGPEMKGKRSTKKNTESRRTVLKKMGTASAFVIPTLMTFKVSELQAQSSRAYKRANDNANFKRD